MELKQVQRILMTNFLFMVLVALLLVLLYETEILEPTNLAADAALVFVITVIMEFVTIVVIPMALKLFSFKAVRHKLMSRKGDALLRWGTARLNMLCLPMLINIFMYYQTMAPAFGYMAIILFLCLFFVYPSLGRCMDETEEQPHSHEALDSNSKL